MGGPVRGPADPGERREPAAAGRARCDSARPLDGAHSRGDRRRVRQRPVPGPSDARYALSLARAGALYDEPAAEIPTRLLNGLSNTPLELSCPWISSQRPKWGYSVA